MVHAVVKIVPRAARNIDFALKALSRVRGQTAILHVAVD